MAAGLIRARAAAVSHATLTMGAPSPVRCRPAHFQLAHGLPVPAIKWPLIAPDHQRLLHPLSAAAAAADGGGSSSGAGSDDTAAAERDWQRVVAILAGCLALMNAHRSTFAVLLPDLALRLGLRAADAGMLHGASLLAYLVGQLPGGRLADRFGGPRVLLCGLALWSAATAATAAAGGVLTGPGAPSAAARNAALLSLLLARVIMGAASACAMPCVTAAAVAWVPAARRASTVGLIYAMFNVGGVAGLAMVPLLADAFGGGGAFVVAGAAGIVWAVAGAALLPQAAAARPPSTQQACCDTPQHDPGMQQEQQPHSQQPPRQRSPLSAWQSWAASDPTAAAQLLLLCGAHATIGAGFFLAQNWLPAYVRSLGAPGLAITGRLSALPWLAAAVVGMAAGSVADGIIRSGARPLRVRRAFQAASFIGCAASVLPLALLPSPPLGLAVGCLAANLAAYALSYGGFHAHLQVCEHVCAHVCAHVCERVCAPPHNCPTSTCSTVCNDCV